MTTTRIYNEDLLQALDRPTLLALASAERLLEDLAAGTVAFLTDSGLRRRIAHELRQAGRLRSSSIEVEKILSGYYRATTVDGVRWNVEKIAGEWYVTPAFSRTPDDVYRTFRSALEALAAWRGPTAAVTYVDSEASLTEALRSIEAAA